MASHMTATLEHHNHCLTWSEPGCCVLKVTEDDKCYAFTMQGCARLVSLTHQRSATRARPASTCRQLSPTMVKRPFRPRQGSMMRPWCTLLAAATASAAAPATLSHPPSLSRCVHWQAPLDYGLGTAQMQDLTLTQWLQDLVHAARSSPPRF